jgi:hypothetical protein
MTINDLLNQWQDSIETAQPQSEELLDEELYQGAGMHVRSDLRSGMFLNDLTNDLTWGFYCV